MLLPPTITRDCSKGILTWYPNGSRQVENVATRLTPFATHASLGRTYVNFLIKQLSRHQMNGAFRHVITPFMAALNHNM